MPENTLPPSATSQSAHSLQPIHDVSRSTVLIVDDEHDARNLLKIALGEGDYNVQCCANADEAIQLMSNALPDLAILDVQMPGKNGLELCQWIKGNSASTFVPVILLTCQNELSQKIHGLNCGADDFITKPFSLPELEARVTSLLRIKKLTNELQSARAEIAEKEKALIAIELAGTAAHELGQPLTSILLNCQLLANAWPEKTLEFEQLMTVVLEQCHRMRQILGHLNSLKHYRPKRYLGETNILDLGEN